VLANLMMMRALAGVRLTAHAEIFESTLSKFPRFVYKDKKTKKIDIYLSKD